MKLIGEGKRSHSFEVRRRAFAIWQKAGRNIWEKPRETGNRKKKKSRDFYKGAFDNIPFLNDDAKRTFSHLMLRPGYMIRDYINGEHERYLAPLTSLIVFYAFFALVSAVLQPVQHRTDRSFLNDDGAFELKDPELDFNGRLSEYDSVQTASVLRNMTKIVQKGYIYLHLDQYPQAVTTQRESSLAALEATLRSQGIPLFIGEFIFLWLAMSMALRRCKVGMSACAAASAYVLCQFSFFMLFAVLLTWGRSSSISILLMFFLLLIDYRQWLGVEWKRGLRLAIRTGIFYGILYLAMILLLSLVVVVLAYFKSRA